jgi:hypothetical protein
MVWCPPGAYFSRSLHFGTAFSIASLMVMITTSAARSVSCVEPKFDISIFDS